MASGSLHNFLFFKGNTAGTQNEKNDSCCRWYYSDVRQWTHLLIASQCTENVLMFPMSKQQVRDWKIQNSSPYFELGCTNSMSQEWTRTLSLTSGLVAGCAYLWLPGHYAWNIPQDQLPAFVRSLDFYTHTCADRRKEAASLQDGAERANEPTLRTGLASWRKNARQRIRGQTLGLRFHAVQRCSTI